MAFKMKGSPMHRNFGIGTPNKKEGEAELSKTQQVENLLKHHDKFKDDPSYNKALSDLMGGKTTYDKESNKLTTTSPITQKKKTKEQLLNEGFTQKDADQMMKDGATTGKQQSSSSDKLSKQQTSKMSKAMKHFSHQFRAKPAKTLEKNLKTELKKYFAAKDSDNTTPPLKQKKTEGFGPRAAKGDDDQSKELAKSRFEMGMYKNDPTKKAKPSQGDFVPAYAGADYSEEDIRRMSESEKEQKIDGYTPKKSPKVMKDGAKTQTHMQGKGAIDFTPYSKKKK
tara:strand:- start:7 stop:852 length:846 start_codon:yes stop_codon:yes gene_type:complete